MSLLPPFCVCHLIGSKPGTQVIYWPLVFHSLLNLQPTGMDLTCRTNLGLRSLSSLPPSLEGTSAASLATTLEFSLASFSLLSSSYLRCSLSPPGVSPHLEHLEGKC